MTGAVHQARPEVHPFWRSSLLAGSANVNHRSEPMQFALQDAGQERRASAAKPRSASRFTNGGGATMEATGNRIEPGRVIGEAFETYRNQVGPLLGGA